MKKKKLIWIDDDTAMMRDAKPMFSEYGFSIFPCSSIAGGLREVMKGRAGNLLLDVDFHGNRKEGMIFLEQIKLIHSKLKVVIFTGFPEVSDSVRAIRKLTASDYITKPIPLTPEKRKAFFQRLHEAFREDSQQDILTQELRDGSLNYLRQVRTALETGNVRLFIQILQSFFASLPYNMKLQESYFQGYIVTVLKMLGVHTEAELETNTGRIDAIATTEKYLYIMEFKLSDASEAINQIYSKKYFQRFFLHKQLIILLGISFDTKERNISGYKMKKAKPKDLVAQSK
jgi:FixJ family two-component response regulator